MSSLPSCLRRMLLPLLSLALVAGLAPTPSSAQGSVAPASASAPAIPAPKPRLALVVGIGSYGTRLLLESATRDTQAVAAALRLGGFEVLLQQDAAGTDLRQALQSFRDKLKPDTVGLVYLTGLAAQVDGRNLLLTSDVVLNESAPAPAVAAVLRAAGMPLQEFIEALGSSAESPRLLLVDAAYRHPALARLAPPGLARLRMPQQAMALLGHAPAALQDLPPISLLPSPPPADPRLLAATRFAKVVVDALTTPRITAAEALRAIRLTVLDGSGGLTQPWLTGDAPGREHLADAARLEAPPPVAAAPSSALATAALPLPTAVPALAVAAPPPVDPTRPALDGRTAAAPGQGERPVFQPRSNAFGHAEGDVFSYQVTDTRKDELLLTYTVAIDGIGADGSLSANGGEIRLDAQGRTQRMGGAGGVELSYEPAQELWWSRAQPGEARAVAFTESYLRADKTRGRIVWRGQAQVGTLRVLETPAGEFEVLPIRSTGQGVDTPEGGAAASTVQLARTVFYAPKLGVPVAVEIEDNDALGRPLRRERVELTHAQQSRVPH